MSLRHLCSPRLRSSLLLGSLLFAGTFQVHAAEEMLRKAVGKGAYEMAVSQQENALWVATSLSRKTDKGGVVYRLDPVTLEVTQAIHNDLKPFGATIDNATQTLWFGNTVNSAVTAIDAKTSEVKGRLVLDDRKRSDTVKPLQPRQLVADDTTNTVYITGIGKESVIWVVDGATLKLKDTITNTGTVAAQLVAREWHIHDAHGREQLVRGLGVVGRQPLLQPGEAHRYTSGCELTTSTGTMHGSYLCVAEDAEVFHTPIPLFVLDVEDPDDGMPAAMPATRILH